MPDNLARMKELEAAATKGPWWWCNDDDSYAMNMDTLCHREKGEPESERDLDRCIAVGLVQTSTTFYCKNCEQNLQFIASLRNAAPKLLELWEAAKAVSLASTNLDASIHSGASPAVQDRYQEEIGKRLAALRAALTALETENDDE